MRKRSDFGSNYWWAIVLLVFLTAPKLWTTGGVGGAYGEEKVNISKILNSFFEQGYDKRIRPNYGGDPVEVGVTMYILSISSVSEVQMDFTMDFYFRQSWKDDRLNFSKRPGFESLTVGAEVADRIWVPDTFFANEKTAYIHFATTLNTFLRIKYDGQVFRSIRITITASCPMDLQYFPMDRQLCTVEIESFGYTMRDIRYKWAKEEQSVSMSADVELPQFKVLGYRQKQKEIPLTTGNYSRLACEIQFVRSMGYYLIQMYIPAGLIVVISWVSFWLHRNATPARVSLGVTTVLTMTTLMSSTNAALPKISYIKSIDVYLGTCFVMVFASLLEYAAVGYLGKRITMRKQRSIQMARIAEHHRQRCAAAAAHHAATESSQAVLMPPGVPDTHLLRATHRHNHHHHHHHQIDDYEVDRGFSEDSYSWEVRLKMMEQNKGYNKVTSMDGNADFDYRGYPKLFGVSPSDIDKYSRVVFPVCFVCFNLMYWIIYLHISDVPLEGIVPKGTSYGG